MIDASELQICFISGPDEAEELQQVVGMLAAMKTPLGVDTETTGLDPREDRVRLVQVAAGDLALVVDLAAFRATAARDVDWGRPGLRELRQLLEGNCPKVAQNAAFDLNFLRGEGVVLGGEIFDTMFAAKIVNNGQAWKNNLGAIVDRELGIEMPKELQKSDWGGELSEEQIRYSARDAWCLPQLVGPLLTKLRKSRVGEGSLYDVFKLEMMCLRPIALMQWHGFGFDQTTAGDLKQALALKSQGLMESFLETLQEKLKSKFPLEPSRWLPLEADGSFNTRSVDSGSIRLGTKRYKGFNPRSVQQMADKFSAVGIILPPNDKGKPSLDQNLLAFIRGDNPLIDAYMTWKESATMVSHIETLLGSVGSDGRIHANYRQMGTDTGRLSCASPNLQQVPSGKEFRSLFVAAPGYKIVVADFSQVELRVAAELSEEPRMLEAYGAGRDLHTETAALMARVALEDVTKDQRSSAKVCFSGDTEVLTETGWISLSTYAGQRVAQYRLPSCVQLNNYSKKPGPGYAAGLPAPWDGNCGVIEFVDPIKYDNFWSDDVWRAADRNCDIVATGTHNILYIDAYGNARRKPLKSVVAPRYFVAAGYLSRTASPLSPLQSRLLAMIVADGSFKQCAGWVSLGFSKRRKIHRCEGLLRECGLDYTKSRYSNGDHGLTTFFKFRLQDAAWIQSFVTEDKELIFESCIQDVDPLAYLAEAQYWDGIAIEGSSRDRVIVGTVVEQTANVMQALAVTAGIPCTVHREHKPESKAGYFYRISYVFRAAPVWRPSWEPVKVSDQQVYCVQVPSEFLLIRRNGKVCVQGNCNFGLLYGAGAATLRKQSVAQYGIDIDIKEAKRLVNQFREAYPRLYEWQIEQGEGTTTAVFTRYGRRRMLIGFNDKFTTRINTQVQGTAGDIAKIAIAKLWEALGESQDEARLIAMVHDEIVLEVREGVVEKWSGVLKGAMEAAGSVVCKLVPIVAEVSAGATWAEAK